MKNSILKKLIGIIIAAAMMLALLPTGFIVAHAESGKCGDNLTWTLDNSGNLTITGNGDMWDYGFDSAPWGTDIVSVTIGDGVTSISAYLFSNCTSLTNITIPNSVTTIGGWAFDNTAYYNNSANWENGVLYIGNCLIKARDDISGSYTVKNGTRIIGDEAFYGCESLENVYISDGVTTIGEGAFYWCVSLKNVTIPDSVTTIGGTLFEYCYSLKSLTIPASVMLIKGLAGWQCPSLKSINVDSNNMAYKSIDGILFTKDGTEIISCPAGKPLTYYAIPDGVTTIGDAAFMSCASLEGVTIPVGVTTIGDNAFYDCTSLTEITLPDSVTEIGNQAFMDCISLESVNIPDGITKLNWRVFDSCPLTSVGIPLSVTEIDWGAFCDCNSLTTVYYDGSEEQWDEIYISGGNDMLLNANILFNYEPHDHEYTSEIIAPTCTKAGCSRYICTICGYFYEVPIDGAPALGHDYVCGVCTRCGYLKGLKYFLSDRAIIINGYDGDETNITIPRELDGYPVEEITEAAFGSCTWLRSVIIPDSVKRIGLTAFSSCTSLTSVTIGNSVTDIGICAFSDCASLTNIIIPNSVTSIGWGAFKNCDALETVYYIGTEDQWNDIEIDSSNDPLLNANIILSYVPHDHDYVISSVVEPTCTEPGKTVYTCSICGYRYTTNAPAALGHDFVDGVCTRCAALTWEYEVNDDGETVTITRYNDTKTEMEVPGLINGYSVTSIGNSAFYNCTGLTSVTIPDSVTSIGNYAFYGCTGLTSVTIPDSVTSIGDWAFHYSDEDEWYDKPLPDVVLYVVRGSAAHRYAIDNGIAFVASGTMSGQCGDDLTWTLDDDGVLTITGTGDMWDYWDDYAPWGTDITSVTIGNGVTSIGAYAFYGCTGLTSVTIPDSVEYIGWDAFSDCTGLTSVTMPDGVTSIGGFAFFDCTGLTSVTIPDSVMSVGDRAFLYTGYYNDASNWEGDALYLDKWLIGVDDDISGAYSIKDGTVGIADEAFSWRENLTNITIPDTVKSIGNAAFYSCTGLESIAVAAGNHVYHSAGNCVIETRSKTLIAGCKNSVIPSDGSVTSIGDSAFSGCTGLTSVTIPDTVTSICFVAFSGCTGLTSIIIPDSLEYIEWAAFSDCTGLTSVTIPDSVKSIEDYAFDECPNVVLHVIKGSVAHRYAINNGIAFEAYVSPKCGDDLTWALDDGVLTISGSGDMYDYDYVWEYGCTTPWAGEEIEQVIIGDSVTSIGDYAFYGCSGLTSVTIPESVASIGDYAFYGCSSLKGVTIPKSVTSIGEDAFNRGHAADTLIVGYSPFGGMFSPFFAETSYDSDVVAMTQINLLNSDRTGAVIEKGINGTTVPYNGTDYTYYGPADLTIVENADGTVDYNFTLREDLTFSDGVPVTIDDVIFSMYTYADPTYNGTSSFLSLPIEGMAEYRAGWATLNNLIFYAGRNNTDFTFWTEAQQTEFWTKYDAAAIALAQEIVDYCFEYGYADEGDIQSAASAWGFWIERNTIEAFADALSEAYGADAASMIKSENAGSSVDDLFPGYEAFSQTAVQTGDSADNIEGIKKTGDYSMTVTLTEVDATAIYNFGIAIAPLHYYGDTSKYDYANNKFGFDKGDLSVARSKTSEPMGAGAYKFIKYEDGVVYFEANDNFYRGVPKTRFVNFKQCLNDDDKLNGVISGEIDITDPSFSTDAISAIEKANSNGELSGNVFHTVTTDNLGYGYIGMCAKVMNVGGDPDSDASKSLRKAFATIFSVYREIAIDSYYGDRAAIINYPISNTSWAAPHPNDDGYKVAFSVDKNGNDIYTDGMTAEEKYAAAKAAALGFFEAAGYTVADGKVVAAPEGASLVYTVWVPGDGCGDHPSYMIMVEAKKALADIGITLNINDLTNSSELWTALYAQEVAIWCAAWAASVDPDMYQIYFSGDEATGRRPGGSNYMYAVDDPELNRLILEARSSTDQAYRKQIYKRCLDIINDWAVEIPVYQRQNAVVFSPERVDLDTVTPDVTTFYGWMNEVQNIVVYIQGDDEPILKVYEGSEAHRYAEENGVTYELIKNAGVKGDADGDGKITVADALAALRVAARLVEPTPELITACDTDGDGKLTVADALAILRVAAKLVPSLD